MGDMHPVTTGGQPVAKQTDPGCGTNDARVPGTVMRCVRAVRCCRAAVQAAFFQRGLTRSRRNRAI
jgi:hypothetical protein